MKPLQSRDDDTLSLATSMVTSEDQFSYNPPAIVRALVQSKLHELSFQRRLDEAL